MTVVGGLSQMNKKAQTMQEGIVFLMAGFMFAVLFLMFGITIATYTNAATKTAPLAQAEFIALRFVNNGDCFAYENEEIGKVFSNRVDLDKFTNENFNSCYNTAELEGIKSLNFKIKLAKRGTEIYTDDYFNNPSFPLMKEVYYYDGNEIVKDQMEILVQDI
jgi:hypothetical protein